MTTYLVCAPLADLAEPYVPSTAGVCTCPCACGQRVWVAEAQILRVPADAALLCYPCSHHLVADAAAQERAAYARVVGGLS